MTRSLDVYDAYRDAKDILWWIAAGIPGDYILLMQWSRNILCNDFFTQLLVCLVIRCDIPETVPCYRILTSQYWHRFF